jgi:hypothetical protein
MAEAKGNDNDSPLEDKARGELNKDLPDQAKLMPDTKEDKNATSGLGQNVKRSHLDPSVQVGSFLIKNSEAKLGVPS